MKTIFIHLLTTKPSKKKISNIMTSWSFNNFDKVKHNNIVYQIKEQTSAEDATPQYVIEDWITLEKLSNVPEDELTAASHEDIINKVWDQFVYNGDKAEASSKIFNHIIKYLSGGNNISFGPGADNTYTFSCNGKTWSKQQS